MLAFPLTSPEIPAPMMQTRFSEDIVNVLADLKAGNVLNAPMAEMPEQKTTN
jgi:hypothetical protein